LAQISSIRAVLAENSRFLGLSPEFNLLMACLAVVISLLQVSVPALQQDLVFIAVWAAVLLASCAIAAWDVVARARRQHGSLAGTVLTTLLHKVLPFMLAIVGLTWVICSFSMQNLWLLPGLWQLLLGLMVFAALPSVPRGMVWVSVWYFASGMVVLALSAQSESVAPWMMGVPFAVGQLAAGLLLVRNNSQGECL
jgi:hypothetical protein